MKLVFLIAASVLFTSVAYADVFGDLTNLAATAGQAVSAAKTIYDWIWPTLSGWFGRKRRTTDADKEKVFKDESDAIKYLEDKVTNFTVKAGEDTKITSKQRGQAMQDLVSVIVDYDKDGKKLNLKDNPAKEIAKIENDTSDWSAEKCKATFLVFSVYKKEDSISGEDLTKMAKFLKDKCDKDGDGKKGIKQSDGCWSIDAFKDDGKKNTTAATPTEATETEANTTKSSTSVVTSSASGAIVVSIAAYFMTQG